MSMEINAVLDQMRAMRVNTGGDFAPPATRVEGPTEFSNVLKDSLRAVSETQKTSADLSLSYVSGNESVDLGDVMVAMQKASLSFEATVQVRNKVLSAYQEVMNMQV